MTGEAEALAALAESLVDALVECRSFIRVETGHMPTVTALSDVIDHARDALRAAHAAHATPEETP